MLFCQLNAFDVEIEADAVFATQSQYNGRVDSSTNTEIRCKILWIV